MELQFYKYTCDCGNVFKALHLLGYPYGQFLLKSETDELAYLDAASSREFNELNKIVDTYFPLDNRALALDFYTTQGGYSVERAM